MTQILLKATDDGLTACRHRSRVPHCELPDDSDHEPNCDGNPFEGDGHERCPCCDLAVCGEPTFGDRDRAYEDSGHCLPCWSEIGGFHMAGCTGSHSWHDGERFCKLNPSEVAR